MIEVRYDHEKSKAAKQEAKKAEIAGIEAYKKTHARKLLQASQLYAYDFSRSSSRAARAALAVNIINAMGSVLVSYDVSVGL